ncbi:MAG TPA: carboxypeptidase-like regulatory domain-containing protein [Ktedonobacterales bacterium]
MPEHPCPPMAVTNRAVELQTTTDATIETTKTDSTGHYRFLVDPGSYIVHVQIEQGEVGMRQVTPGEVSVGPGEKVTLDISLDTGIR